MLPTISVIIPTFNSQQTIECVLKSLVEQTFEMFEIVIIDGKSSDKTLEIVSAYAKTDERILFISENDDGIYDAMNKGITMARGSWLLFLGSDDRLYDQNVLKDVMDVIKEQNKDLIYGDAILTSSSKRYGGEFNTKRLHTEGNLCHQSVFYHKRIFERLGKYNLRYKVLADWDFNIRCFSYPELRAHYFQRVISLYNNQTGISSRPYQDPFYEQMAIRYIQERNILSNMHTEIMNSPSYRVGNIIYQTLKRIGVIAILRKLTR